MKRKILRCLLSCTMVFMLMNLAVSGEEWGDEQEWLSEDWGEPKGFEDSFDEEWNAWEADFEESEFEEFEEFDEFQTDDFSEADDSEAWDSIDESDWMEDDLTELMPGEESPAEEAETVDEAGAESLVEDIPQTISDYSGECGDDLTWALSGGTLRISGSGPMWNYNNLYFTDSDGNPTNLPPWHPLCIPDGGPITRVVISEGVTQIGGNAFANLEDLSEISIPESVTVIGYEAFIFCANLKLVKLPSTLKEIQFQTFAGSGLESIVIPNGVEVIGKDAFRACGSLKSVQIPSTVKEIGEAAFLLSALESVVIPEGIDVINGFTFASCYYLKSVTLPSTLKEIGTGAFQGNLALESIVIPEGVEILGNRAFADSNLQSVTLPSTLKEIGDEAFTYTWITDIRIPESVTSIGLNVFAEVENLAVTARCSSYAAQYCEEQGIKLNRIHDYKMTVDTYATVTTTGHGTAKCVCGETGSQTVAKLVPFKTITAENVSSFKNIIVSIPKKKSLFYQGVEVVKIVMPENGDLRINVSNKNNVSTTVLNANGSNTGTKYTITGTTKEISLKKGTYYLFVQRKYTEDAFGCNRTYPSASMKVNLRYRKDNTITANDVTRTYSASEQKFKLPVSALEDPGFTYSVKGSDVKVSSGGTVTVPAKYIGKVEITVKSKVTSLYRPTSKTITLTVKPSQPVITSLENIKTRSLKVKWSYSSVVSGYEVALSTSSTFPTKSTKVQPIMSNKTLTYTFKSLTLGKKYYVRMRKYKTWDGEKIYSSWSPVKSIVIKK